MTEPEQCISKQEILDRMKAGNIIVVDVRNPDEVAGGRIEAERWANIPLPEFEDALKMTETDFKNKYKQTKPLENGSDLVVHCGMGRRGAKAWAIAHKMGFREAKHFLAGYKSWN